MHCLLLFQLAISLQLALVPFNIMFLLVDNGVLLFKLRPNYVELLI